MGRRAKQPHEIIPTEHKGQARVCYLGRWYYLGPWDARANAPSAEAMSHLARLRLVWRDDPGAKGVHEDAPLAVLWADWRESPEGRERYVETSGRVERYLFGSGDAPGPYRYVLTSEFRGRDMCAVQLAMSDGGLSKRTIRAAMACLRALTEWAKLRQRIRVDHAAELSAVELPPKGIGKRAVRRKGVAREAVKPALEFLSPPLRAVVELLWWTGARPSELLTLRGGDVRRAGKVEAMSGLVLDLDKLGVWAAVKREHKTDDASGGYDRVIFFGPNARRIIEPFLDAADGVPLFRPAVGREWDLARKRATRKPGNYGTYKKRKGDAAKRKPSEVYRSHALTVATKRACDRVKDGVAWLPYDLRRACGVRVQSVYQGNGARVFLGHKVGGVTERYSGADLTLAAKIAAEMG